MSPAGEGASNVVPPPPESAPPPPPEGSVHTPPVWSDASHGPAVHAALTVSSQGFDSAPCALPSLVATWCSTSGVLIVSNTGRITGWTSDWTPLHVRLSPHDSSGWWSGRMRSHICDVSSGYELNETRNAAFFAASAKPIAFGRLYAGSVPCTSSTPTLPELRSAIAFCTSPILLAIPRSSVRSNLSVVPMPPATLVRTFAATTAAVAF